MKNSTMLVAWLAVLAGCASPPPPVNEQAYFEPTLLKAAPATTVALTNAGNGQWLVHAMVNGQPGVFAVDTGAAYTLITPQFAHRLGLDKKAVNGRLAVQGPRPREVGFTRISEFELGGFDYVGFFAPIINLDHINRAARTDLDGILGNNLLCQTACVMDWSRQTLTLESREIPPPGNAIPVSFREDRVFLTAQVNGQSAEFVLDTGAYRSLLAEPELQRLKISSDHSTSVTVPRIDISEARLVNQTQVSLDGFQAGVITRENYPILVWTHSVLGMDLLEPWVLAFDARHGWLTLTAPSAVGK